MLDQLPKHFMLVAAVAMVGVIIALFISFFDPKNGG